MRRNPLWRSFATFTACLSAATMSAGGGPTVQFNTDTGQLTVNGSNVTSLNGTSFTSSVVDGTQQFRFAGDLDFNSGDFVTAIGSRPLSLLAGNDVNIPAGVSLNFNASG